MFNGVLQVHYVTAALCEKVIRRFELNCGDIVVKTIFGEDCIPVVTRHIKELFYIADELKAYIFDNLSAYMVVPSNL